MSNIMRLCAKFYNNPSKSYFPKDFKDREGWNYNSIKKQLRRLLKEGIITQLPDGKYILSDSDKAYYFLENRGDKDRWASKIYPPHHIRAKAHNLSKGIIDMSGEPLEWMLRWNMLTKPKPDDPAQNVGLRDEQAKKFNMRISLRNGKAIVYPKSKGWESELLTIFSWCGDFIQRLENINENMEIAINFVDLQRIRPDLKDIPFEAIQGIEIFHDGMHIQLCRSQFPEGEICIRSNSIEETMSLADKITYGNRNLAQAMKETALEKRIHSDLQLIKGSLTTLPSILGKVVGEAVKEAVRDGIRDGIRDGFNEATPTKPDSKIGYS